MLCGLLLFTACAADKNEFDNLTAEEAYNRSWDYLQETKYVKAATGFEKVETDHPYSKWAVKSKLMGAYAYYKNEQYDEAIMALDRFIKYHPGNKDVAYAYYLKGICYYDQISAADRDQGDTEKAKETFEWLVTLFPDSKYAEDARKKMNLTEDYRAGQEMIIGRFYLKDKNYLAALNRFNIILENYQTTVQIEEALYREVEIYAILGLNKYADGYYKILRDNYPQGKWTLKAQNVMEKINHNKQPADKTMQKSVEAVTKKADKNKDTDVKQNVAQEKGFWHKTADFLWPWGNKDENAETTAKVKGLE